MPPILGIDLGTTNSCLATLEHGQPRVLENAEGARTTPSVVAFLDDDEKLVGAAAHRQAVTNPERTIFSIKRFMGRRLQEVSAEQQTVPYHLVADENDAVRVLVDGVEYAPEQLSAAVLSKLKVDAEAYYGHAVADAVITVPAYFNDAQRQATKDAAAIAGLNVLRIINEPTAAALAYGFAQEQGDEKTILVFDLGGGTFDVSVLEIGDGVYEVQATKGDNHLGGNDFDKLIVDWLIDDFEAVNHFDLASDAVALQRLYEAAEKAKIELSTALRSHISLPFIAAVAAGPLHLDVVLTRAELNKICAQLLARLEEPVRKAIADAKSKGTDEIDHVLLVGGMTRMPAIQEAVKEITDIEPLRGVNPDEAVAIGAALQAGVLVGEVEEVLLLDVIPLALGIETRGGIFTKLIPANTTIPKRITEIFTTAEDNQPSVEVHVLQGERDMAVSNRSLGRVVLLGIPPASAGTPQIEVTFDVNSDGILSVQARDLGTGAQKETTIKESTGLDSDEVDRMRSEAEQFVEADRAAREYAETRNRAELLRDQGRRTLRAHAEDMDADDTAAIVAAMTDLEAVLDNEAADIPMLVSAFAALEATLQAFAEKLYSEIEAPEIDDEVEVVFAEAVEIDEASASEFTR
jgi:molecular chaperone DnaK